MGSTPTFDTSPFCTFVLQWRHTNATVAQLVRAPACHAGGRRFKSARSRKGKTPILWVFFIAVSYNEIMKNNFLLQSLTAFVFFVLSASNASAAGTIKYNDSSLGLSFAHSANFMNSAESKEKFWSGLCGKTDRAFCMKDAVNLYEQKFVKDCLKLKLKDCPAPEDASRNPTVENVASMIVKANGEKTDTSTDHTFRDAIKGSGSFSYATQGDKNKIAFMVKDKTSFYKKNKNGISFYWSGNTYMCAIKNANTVCFNVQVKGYVPSETKSVQSANKKKVLAILSPIVTTLNFAN